MKFLFFVLFSFLSFASNAQSTYDVHISKFPTITLEHLNTDYLDTNITELGKKYSEISSKDWQTHYGQTFVQPHHHFAIGMIEVTEYLHLHVVYQVYPFRDHILRGKYLMYSFDDAGNFLGEFTIREYFKRSYKLEHKPDSTHFERQIHSDFSHFSESNKFVTYTSETENFKATDIEYSKRTGIVELLEDGKFHVTWK